MTEQTKNVTEFTDTELKAIKCDQYELILKAQDILRIVNNEFARRVKASSSDNGASDCKKD